MFGNKMISILASIMMIAFSVFYNLLALPVDMRQPIGKIHSFLQTLGTETCSVDVCSSVGKGVQKSGDLKTRCFDRTKKVRTLIHD